MISKMTIEERNHLCELRYKSRKPRDLGGTWVYNGWQLGQTFITNYNEHVDSGECGMLGGEELP